MRWSKAYGPSLTDVSVRNSGWRWLSSRFQDSGPVALGTRRTRLRPLRTHASPYGRV